MQIAVIGLGKIGLPLAVQFAKKGRCVIGVDTNEETVKKINQGIEPFPGENNLSVFLPEVIKSNLFSATSNYAEALVDAEIIVIAIPLLIDELHQPDFRILDAVSKSIGLHIRKGALVILETTVPVGTTRDRLSINIEKYSALKAGRDFLVAFSPERVFTGRIFDDLRRYPKLVGGINQESGLRAKVFYEDVLDFDDRPDLERKNGVWLMQSAEAAELSKLAETTYRDINIAMVNQFAIYSSEIGIDIYDIIEASNSQPFCHLHKPGVSVGGHCIPVYPWLFLHTNPRATLVLEARKSNLQMPSFVITKTKESFGSLEGVRVGVLGLSYRAGVKEDTLSGTYDLVKLLIDEGAIVGVFDPLYSNQEIESRGLSNLENIIPVQLLILHTPHKEFETMDYNTFGDVSLVIDSFGMFHERQFAKHTVIKKLF